MLAKINFDIAVSLNAVFSVLAISICAASGTRIHAEGLEAFEARCAVGIFGTRAQTQAIEALFVGIAIGERCAIFGWFRGAEAILASFIGFTFAIFGASLGWRCQADIVLAGEIGGAIAILLAWYGWSGAAVTILARFKTLAIAVFGASFGRGRFAQALYA